MTRAWILPVFLVMLAGMLAGALGRDLGGLLFFSFLFREGDGIARGGRRGWGVVYFPFAGGYTYTNTSYCVHHFPPQFF